MIQNPLSEDRALRSGPSADPPTDDRKPVVIAVGGDARQITVIRALRDAGYPVAAAGLTGAAGLPPGTRLLNSLRAADEPGLTELTAGAGCVVLLPLPVSRDASTVFCPLDPDARIPLSDVAALLRRTPGASVLGGCLTDALKNDLESAAGPGRVADYYAQEAVLLKNARVTAEGAIMTAMEVTDTALLGSRAAVIGYGRIGRYLARLLVGLGVRVTVCARREESRAAAEGDGCGTVDLSAGRDALKALCHGYDVIYNTVPAPLMDGRLLEVIDPDTRIIDLASAPGGVSGRACMRVIRAPSLPGRYAPKTAGRIVADAVLALLDGGFGRTNAGREVQS